MPRNALSTTSIGKLTTGAGDTVVEVVVELALVVVVGLEVGETELEGGDATGAANVVTSSVDDSGAVAVAVTLTDAPADDPSSEPAVHAATEIISTQGMTEPTTDQQRIHPGWQGRPSGEWMFSPFMAVFDITMNCRVPQPVALCDGRKPVDTRGSSRHHGPRHLQHHRSCSTIRLAKVDCSQDAD